MLPQRPELRVIITSATIDPQRFAEFFGGAPIIEVSGRSYPVEVRYRPLVGDERGLGAVARPKASSPPCRSWIATIAATCSCSCRARNRSATSTEALGKARAASHRSAAAVLRGLSTRDQERIFEQHGARRIVLATNVAETSLTVPGIRHVVDSGPGAHQPLQRARQGAAPADRADFAGQRRSAQRSLRARKSGHLHSAVRGGRLRRSARRSRRRRSCARISRASSCRWRRWSWASREDFPFVDPPDTRLINDGYRAAAGAEGGRRIAHA